MSSASRASSDREGPQPREQEVNTPLDASAILSAAADLLTPIGAWTQFVYARDGDGIPVRRLSAEAKCWCALGAVTRVAGSFSTDPVVEARRRLGAVVGREVVEWNDETDRQQEDVVSALREAASLSDGALQSAKTGADDAPGMNK